MRFETTATDNFGTTVLDLNFDNVVEKSTQLLNIMSAPAEGHSFRIRLLTYFDGSPIAAEDLKYHDKVSYEFRNGSWLLCGVDGKGFEVTKKDIEIAIWQTLDALQERFWDWQQHA